MNGVRPGYLFASWTSGRHGFPTHSQRHGVTLADGVLKFTRAGRKTLTVKLTLQGRRFLELDLGRGVASVTITAMDSFTSPAEGDRLSSGTEWLGAVEIAHPFALASG